MKRPTGYGLRRWVAALFRFGRSKLFLLILCLSVTLLTSGCDEDSWWSWLTLVAWTAAGVFVAQAFALCAVYLDAISDAVGTVTLVLNILCFGTGNNDICGAARTLGHVGDILNVGQIASTTLALNTIEATAAGAVRGFTIAPEVYRWQPDRAVGLMANAGAEAVNKMETFNVGVAAAIDWADDTLDDIDTAASLLRNAE